MTEQPRSFTADPGDDLKATRLRVLMLRTHAADSFPIAHDDWP